MMGIEFEAQTVFRCKCEQCDKWIKEGETAYVANEGQLVICSAKCQREYVLDQADEKEYRK